MYKETEVVIDGKTYPGKGKILRDNDRVCAVEVFNLEQPWPINPFTFDALGRRWRGKIVGRAGDTTMIQGLPLGETKDDEQIGSVTERESQGEGEDSGGRMAGQGDSSGLDEGSASSGIAVGTESKT